MQSQHKQTNGPSIRSLVLDEERMRPGHWLGSVLCVFFSALTLLVEWQEEHQPVKTWATSPQRFSSRCSGHLGFTQKMAIKMETVTDNCASVSNISEVKQCDLGIFCTLLSTTVTTRADMAARAPVASSRSFNSSLSHDGMTGYNQN